MFTILQRNEHLILVNLSFCISAPTERVVGPTAQLDLFAGSARREERGRASSMPVDGGARFKASKRSSAAMMRRGRSGTDGDVMDSETILPPHIRSVSDLA